MIRHREWRRGRRASVGELFAMEELVTSLFEKVERRRGRVRLEVGAGAIAFQRIAPLRDLPLELDLRQIRGARQADLDAGPGRLDAADVHGARERRRPEARQRTAAGVERERLAAMAIVPA